MSSLLDDPIIIAHRVDRFEQMGFGFHDAHLLAVHHDEEGNPVDVHAVQRAISKGCPKELALDIFL